MVYGMGRGKGYHVLISSDSPRQIQGMDGMSCEDLAIKIWRNAWGDGRDAEDQWVVGREAGARNIKPILQRPSLSYEPSL